MTVFVCCVSLNSLWGYLVCFLLLHVCRQYNTNYVDQVAAMEKKATQLGTLGVSKYTLLKKPLDHLGKQLNVPG